MTHLSRHPTSYPTRYQQIAAQLEQELCSQYRCGDYLPSEQQLAERYQVNRHTLRRAVDELVERGWLQRRHGIVNVFIHAQLALVRGRGLALRNAAFVEAHTGDIALGQTPCQLFQGVVVGGRNSRQCRINQAQQARVRVMHRK